MSRYSHEQVTIKEFSDIIADMAYQNAIMQEALEHIASDTEECSQQIAQETLEAIAVNNNNKKE